MSRSPADSLDRMILPNGWVVVDRIPVPKGSTGSFFSIGYVVESAETGQRAFLKALDLKGILDAATDQLAALEESIRIYNFERDVCRQCRRMDRVVAILDAGDVRTDPSDPFTIVPYLIFERASGDVRAFLNASRDVEVAWALRSLHHTATGLKQLHDADIAHQDLKPSNVLVFGLELSKIADLGRASHRSSIGPHDGHLAAGALPYAPPELLYGQVSPDFEERRFACDLYLLGSMLAFYFTGASMTGLILNHLTVDVRPRSLGGGWAGDYAAATPLVLSAFALALDEFSTNVPERLRDDLVELLRDLCNPDTRRRGNPRAHRRGGNPFALDYFVSRFNALASRSEARVRLGAP